MNLIIRIYVAHLILYCNANPPDRSDSSDSHRLRANRHRQAWSIFIPLVSVLFVWRMPLMLLGVPDGSTENVSFLVVSAAMAWTMVWLLGHWLKSSYRSVTFFLMLGLMIAIGLLAALVARRLVARRLVARRPGRPYDIPDSGGRA